MELRWHPYKYYPYERELALREIHELLSPNDVTKTSKGVRIEGSVSQKALERLVYFSEIKDGEKSSSTMQARLERANGNVSKRQLTRYSVHGLHEYKGRFNPQIVRVILNILNVPTGNHVIDPFCGSGTSLVECSHVGIKAVGTDINPLAVYLANAKLSALKLPARLVQKEIDATIRRFKAIEAPSTCTSDARIEYLRKWFDREILNQIENLRSAIEVGREEYKPLLLSITSDLLRDYSQQDPNDLRIRRRKTPLPETPFICAFEDVASRFRLRLLETQHALVGKPAYGKAILMDCRSLKRGKSGLGRAKFDCAITSPPYSSALPYIDTQRLSLVWLGLLSPEDLLDAEARLIGSREVRGTSKHELLRHMMVHRNGLPKGQSEFCLRLQSALSEEDGFRRQAVPFLLYRYFAGMAQVFRSVRQCVKDGAPFALVVGRNHTVLGGERFDINTPQHLTEIANSYGWAHKETVSLQTYQRYGYHMNNAVNSEGLVILKAE